MLTAALDFAGRQPNVSRRSGLPITSHMNWLWPIALVAGVLWLTWRGLTDQKRGCGFYFAGYFAFIAAMASLGSGEYQYLLFAPIIFVLWLLIFGSDSGGPSDRDVESYRGNELY